MRRRRCLALAALVLAAPGALAGCMKPAASAGPAPIVIPVAAVGGAPVVVGGAADNPHAATESDGHVAGEHVVVETHGAWLPATLVERRGGRWLVRYDVAWGGARDALEEVVETARIRASAPPSEEDHSPDDGDP